MSSEVELKHSKELIQLRRDKVLSLMSVGLQGKEIAQQLGVAQSTICLDIQFLKETANENLKDYVEHKIPQQWQECKAALRLILTEAYKIYTTSDRNSERTQALALMSDTVSKLDQLSSDSKILNQAIDWINKKKESLQQEQVLQEQESQDQEIQEQDPLPVQESDPVQETSEESE